MIRWITAIALAAVVLATSLAEAQQKWKAVATSRPTQFGQWTWLAEEMDKRTGGQLKLDVISLPELGLTGFELVRVTRLLSGIVGNTGFEAPTSLSVTLVSRVIGPLTSRVELSYCPVATIVAACRSRSPICPTLGRAGGCVVRFRALWRPSCPAGHRL